MFNHKKENPNYKDTAIFEQIKIEYGFDDDVINKILNLYYNDIVTDNINDFIAFLRKACEYDRIKAWVESECFEDKSISLNIVLKKFFLIKTPKEILNLYSSQEKEEKPITINKNDHYYVLMESTDDKGAVTENWVECVIDETRYYVSDNYKVELKPLEPGYSNKVYYIFMLKSEIKAGSIVKKEPDMEPVYTEWEEPLTSYINLHHSGYILQKVPKTDKYKKYL